MVMQKPQIKWINHASYLINFNNIRLVTDPWLFGPAFDDGWSLLVESEFQISDFAEVTHIWFSHEHPDHFSPGVLSKIPEDIRKKITILFQETQDKRVVSFCEKLSFKIMELKNKKKYCLSDNFSITCGKFEDIDSWLLTEVNDLKILNINDCTLDNPNKCGVVKKISGAVDVLLTQFSYANWVGNPEDKSMRETAAEDKLNVIKIQVDTFSPKYTIPFASFVYFSHEENQYLNDCINRVDVACDFIVKQTSSLPVIMYPGDKWDLVSEVSNDKTLARYRDAYNFSNKIYKSPDLPLTRCELLESSQKYIKQIEEKNSIFFIRALEMLPEKYGFKKIKIRLMDSQDHCEFSLKKGLRFSDNMLDTDVTLSTRSLNQIFKFPWGIGTVLVNGRYRGLPETKNRLYRIFMIGLMNSTDKYLNIGFIINRVVKKISTNLFKKSCN